MAAQVPTSRQSSQADSLDTEASDHYTGVVVIHGIGDIKRNTTLQQALNALTYWFSQHAELQLRANGRGRVWLSPTLGDVQNPDVPASHATIELSAPADVAEAMGDNSTLQLQFREVWWAESFGLPAIGPIIQWARVQFLEQAAHLLIPLVWQTRSGTAAQSQADAEPKAPLTQQGREDSGNKHADSDLSSGSQSTNGQRPLSTDERIVLHGLLGLYGLVQYVWKVVQWLALTPLIILALLLMGLVRLLAVSAFQPAAVALLSRATSYLMLHWVAPLQVYLTDFTLSSAMRQRFEREVERFLHDKHCDRVVVIAHSMGTVIAYEGLTMVLDPSQETSESQKPVTFICLAQALRRMWLPARADLHRLRGVLPDRVRWLHFWAHYDPVTAGPLTARALPRIENWTDPEVPNPETRLRASLRRCKNIDVVNSDSTFADHTGYWDNQEEVVGPIARELVAGHPALEYVVKRCLATPDDVLRRRCQVALRALWALAGGFAAGAAVFLWNWRHDWATGVWIHNFVRSKAFLDLVIAVLTKSPPCFGCAAYPPPPHMTRPLNPMATLVAVLSAIRGAEDPLITVGVAAAVGSLGIVLVGRLVATLSPLVSHTVPQTSRANAASISLLSALALALFFVDDYAANSFIPSLPGGDAINWPGLGLLAYLLGLFLAVLALILCVSRMARDRHWGWLVALSVITVLLRLLTSPDALFLGPLLVAVVYGLWASLPRIRGATRKPARSRSAALTLVGQGTRWVAATGLTLSALAWLAVANPLPSTLSRGQQEQVRVTVFSLPEHLLVSEVTAGADGNLWLNGGFEDSGRGSIMRVTTAGVVTGEFPLALQHYAYPPTIGPNGNLWFIDFPFFDGKFAIGQITPAGVITEFPVPKAVVTSFTAGPDGNLWFTDGEGNLADWGVGRMTPMGQVTRSQLQGVIFADSITVGPGGNLWFSCLIGKGESGTRGIGRITSAGVITLFPVPRSDSLLRWDSVLDVFSTGSDGNLWFTENGSENSSAIGQITPAGVVTGFHVLHTSPNAYTVGPDHNLWFTEERSAIGRITPAGVITEFPIPDGAGAGYITVGPDHNLWFTEERSAIGRITPAGVITEFPIPDGAVASYMAVGPDGNLWFTGHLHEKLSSSIIGRISL